MSDTVRRVPAGVPTGGQFAASARTEPDVDLTGEQAPTVHDLFDDPDDAERAADFEFDWSRMDYDDYNGWSHYDPDAPYLTRTWAENIRVGDEVLIPGTTSAYRRAIKVSTWVGGEREGLADIWTEDQDPLTEEPAISARERNYVSTRPFRPEPDLADPAQFHAELLRCTYAETAVQASKADERHDVERIAERLAGEFTRDLVREALAQRQA